jgi:hypothetical protein
VLGVRRLGAEQVVVDLLPAGQPADVPLHGRHARGAATQPQRGRGVAVELAAIVPVERGRGPDEVDPGAVLRRELAGGGVDPGDAQPQLHRLAAGAEHSDRERAARGQVQRLGQRERDVDLVGSSGIREPAGQDLAVPQDRGDLAVRGRDEGDHGRVQYGERG